MKAEDETSGTDHLEPYERETIIDCGGGCVQTSPKVKSKTQAAPHQHFTTLNHSVVCPVVIAGPEISIR